MTVSQKSSQPGASEHNFGANMFGGKRLILEFSQIFLTPWPCNFPKIDTVAYYLDGFYFV